MVSRVQLTEEQEQPRVRVCRDRLEAEAQNRIFLRVITGDESWVHEYDLPKKTAPRTVFFDCPGIMMLEWVPEVTTVNGPTYVQTSKTLRERTRKKRADLLANNSWFMLQGNVGPDGSVLVSQSLSKNQTTVIEQAAYSPDLFPSDFWLFDRSKDSMKDVIWGQSKRSKRKR